MSNEQPSSDVTDRALAHQGRVRVDWAERAMPALRQVRRRFADEQPLAGVTVGACLHVTVETAVLVRTLRDGGARVALCASNPLSTRDDVAAALADEVRVEVHARQGVDRDGYYAHIDAVLDRRPQLVLDDGCDLVGRAHTDRTDVLDALVAGCEQTASGVVRLHQMAQAGALGLPMLAYDDSPTKRLLDNRFGTGQSTVDAIVRSTNMLLAGRTVVVAGYGPVGRGVAERARGMGATVVVTEVDPIRALEATLQGHRVLPMTEAAALADVLVTVTGNRDVLRAEHLDLLRDGAVLANSGHFDVEIDVRALAAAAVQVHRGVRPHADEYTLADGRRVLLLARGRVVNLGAAEGNPSSVMDVSFAGEALALAWLREHAGGLPAGVHAPPPQIDRTVAALELTAFGVRIDALTPQQQAYLSSWESGS